MTVKRCKGGSDQLFPSYCLHENILQFCVCHSVLNGFIIQRVRICENMSNFYAYMAEDCYKSINIISIGHGYLLYLPICLRPRFISIYEYPTSFPLTSVPLYIITAPPSPANNNVYCALFLPLKHNIIVKDGQTQLWRIVLGKQL